MCDIIYIMFGRYTCFHFPYTVRSSMSGFKFHATTEKTVSCNDETIKCLTSTYRKCGHNEVNVNMQITIGKINIIVFILSTNTYSKTYDMDTLVQIDCGPLLLIMNMQQ